MIIYGINIPNVSLTNLDLLHYAQELNIPNFRGVFMRDTLPHNPRRKECGIVNLNTSKAKRISLGCVLEKREESYIL